MTSTNAVKYLSNMTKLLNSHDHYNLFYTIRGSAVYLSSLVHTGSRRSQCRTILGSEASRCAFLTRWRPPGWGAIRYYWCQVVVLNMMVFR